jgi:hypothetical protein
VSGEATQNGGLAPNIMGGGTSCSTAGIRGDFLTASREAESKVGLVLVFPLGLAHCAGRPRAVPLVRESPGFERGELNCGRGARNGEFVARSVEVDAESEVLNPLAHEEGGDSERDAWVGLLAETKGVRKDCSTTLLCSARPSRGTKSLIKPTLAIASGNLAYN